MKMSVVSLVLLFAVAVQASQVDQVFGMLQKSNVGSAKTLSMLQKLVRSGQDMNGVMAVVDTTTAHLTLAYQQAEYDSDFKLRQKADSCVSTLKQQYESGSTWDYNTKKGLWYNDQTAYQDTTLDANNYPTGAGPRWENQRKRCENEECGDGVFTAQGSAGLQCAFKPQTEENFNSCSLDNNVRYNDPNNGWSQTNYNTCVEGLKTTQGNRYQAKFDECTTKEGLRNTGRDNVNTRCETLNDARIGAMADFDLCWGEANGIMVGDSDLLNTLRTHVTETMRQLAVIKCIFQGLNTQFEQDNNAQLSLDIVGCTAAHNSADHKAAKAELPDATLTTISTARAGDLGTYVDVLGIMQQTCGADPALTKNTNGHPQCEFNEATSVFTNGQANLDLTCSDPSDWQTIYGKPTAPADPSPSGPPTVP